MRTRRGGPSRDLPDWLFLDCEWADTLASELVSLALVPADPERPEFYAERKILPENPTPFVAAAVYPLLDRGRVAMSDLAIADSLRRYLASFRDPIIMHDTGIDLMLLGDALSHPGCTEPAPRLRPNLIGIPGYLQRIEHLFSGSSELRLRRHHALVDARVARDAFLWCVG
jgi:hypothetical protein